MRLDQAIAPAGLIKSAVAYSLFIVDDGMYAIKTGPGWRMQVRGRHRSELMTEAVRRVEAVLDPLDLAGELAVRDGSLFVSAVDLADVALSRRFDLLPDLRFTDGSRKYRFQFDEGRLAEVEPFVEALSAMAVTNALDEVTAAALRKIEQALEHCETRLDDARRDLGRGGSAEQQDRHERIHQLEITQAAFRRALEQ